MAKLTIRDIAAFAGLSASTVWLVLNNSPKVDPATCRHLLTVIRRCGPAPVTRERRGRPAAAQV